MVESRIVIVGYKPFRGKEKVLEALMKTHVDILRSQGLATDRTSVMMRSEDGTIVEVFEWVSQEAIDSAHANPVVQEMWAEFAEVCEYVPVGQLKEAAELFSAFAPLPS